MDNFHASLYKGTPNFSFRKDVMARSNTTWYPVFATDQSALRFSPWQTFFIPMPTRLHWEAFGHAAITAQRLFLHMSTTVYRVEDFCVYRRLTISCPSCEQRQTGWKLTYINMLFRGKKIIFSIIYIENIFFFISTYITARVQPDLSIHQLQQLYNNYKLVLKSFFEQHIVCTYSFELHTGCALEAAG